MVPIGSIIAIGWLPRSDQLARWENASGWLYCDGRALPRLAPYTILYNSIRYNFGSGASPDNPTQTTGDFNIPDLRGRFLRGVDDSGKFRDPDADKRSSMISGGNALGVGSIQGDETKSHDHKAKLHDSPYSSVPIGKAEWPSGFGGGGLFADGGASGWSRSPDNVSVSLEHRGGKETRPVNAAVLWIIKFKDAAAADIAALNAELESKPLDAW